MRIAFFGLPLAAIALARDGHAIVYAGICRRAPGLRRLATQIAPGRTWLVPDTARRETVDRVREAAPDLVVSWFWTRKLPPEILALAPSLGVHPSLLPRHRGPDPYFWAIDAGDEITGVSAHRLDVEYDTGAVFARRALVIDPTWNAWRLARALDRPSLALLRQVAGSFAAGGPPDPEPQDPRGATEAPEPAEEDLAIRYAWTSARIERRVRAAAPWPGAWTEIGDRVVTLVRVRPTTVFPKALERAEAAVRRDGLAVVRTCDSAIELLEGRDEDDRPLGLADLARLVDEARRSRG
jgi:methionyl-tRNA formyltransferase